MDFFMYARELGTTSACAENTVFPIIFTPHPWNYLRVRGEYQRGILKALDMLELPPRARRIQSDPQIEEAPAGTTSACAENTINNLRRSTTDWNYLRVRGEYLFLPPRVHA